MALLKHGKLLFDRWDTVETAQEALKPGAKFVSLDLWQAERDVLRGKSAIGVILPNDVDPEVLAEDLDRIAAIRLSFPAFADGRAFSQARILRDRLNYQGELRAAGPVFADQYAFLLRCGFDAVEVPADIHVPTWLEAAARFQDAYQPASDAKVPAYRLRAEPRQVALAS